MTKSKRLYRSRKALIGGVCAGAADYFNVDPLVTRILAVVFGFATLGLLFVPYVALCLVLPLEPCEAAPLDVKPHSVRSEIYGAVGFEEEKAGPPGPDAAKRDARRGAAPPAPEPGRPYAPPAEGPFPPPPAPPAGYPQGPFPPPAGYPQGAWAGPAFAPAPRESAGQSARGVKAALWLSSFALFFVVAGLVASHVEGALWWQYWPLLLVILGTVRMVVPSAAGRRTGRFVAGLVAFCMGIVLMPMSLGVLDWQSLGLMLACLWPFLLMALGLYAAGLVLKSSAITLLAGLCFAAFCIAGLVWCSIPGVAPALVLQMPFGRAIPLDLSFWGA